MEPLKILIDNWPVTNLVTVYTPIFIAAVAVVVSLYSAHISRKSFLLSSRPYIWAANYGVIDQANRTITPVPSRLMYRVNNSPAKVLESKVSVLLGRKELFSHDQNDYVCFPDEGGEWTFSIGQDEFERIMNEFKSSNETLYRKVKFKYSDLGKLGKFEYELNQEFVTVENQWKDISSNAI